MSQSTLNPHHTAIIMDGNGRWATARGLPRAAGHARGAQSLRSIVEAAPLLGIRTLTIYAFSSDNWNRPQREVQALMHLLAKHLRSESAHFTAAGVRMSMIGRRDRLPDEVLESAAHAEAQTANGHRLHLRLAIDYSARESIWRAARNSTANPRSSSNGEIGEDVDFLIRTGGEQRLSDFLLWESAYAELYFTPVLWPDFGPADLIAAVAHFRRRDRRYGHIPANPEPEPFTLGQLWTQHDGRCFSQLRRDRWLR